MHSKVIIASLVCMLAASFGAGGKITSGFKKAEFHTPEMVCYAPNDEQNHFEFENDCVYAESPFFITFVGEKTTFTKVSIVRQTGVMLSGGTTTGKRISFSLIVGCGVEDRTIVVRFRSKKIGGATCERNLYVHSENGYSCISALSISDAKAKYFMNCVATPEERETLANGSPSFIGSSSGSGIDYPGGPYDPGHPGPNPPFPPFPDPNPPRVGKNRLYIEHEQSGLDNPLFSFDPFTPTTEEKYVNYIYGDSQDMTFTVNLVSKGLYTQRVGTGLNAQVNWYDDSNTVHPAKGVSVQFYSNGEVLNDYRHEFSTEPMSYDYRTNSTGYCTVNVMSSVKLNSLQARICADSSSTRVEDNFKIDYPFFARASDELLSLPLSEYAEITFTINIRQNRSERGEAFAISQKQNIPYNYCKQFADDIDAAKTIYPSENTYYDSNHDKIMVQKEDCNSWDVLNHEYGHYISDKLDLCNFYHGRRPHNIYDDLTIEYGETAAKELAYSEGLATYLGIASQMYSAGEFSSVDFADEIYHDRFRSVEANYSEYFLEANDNEKAERIEVCVTGAMIKLLDNINREYDDVALGHAAMWNAIQSAGRCYAAGNLFLKIAEQNPEFFSEINQLLNRERFAEIPPQSQPQEPEDDWTLIFYTCDTCQATHSRDIDEPYIPDNINFVCEGGSGGNMVRKHKVGNEYITDMELEPNSVVGDGELFKDFITWALRTFPAKKTAVVITNHGQGYLGCCIDDNFTDDVLTNHEIRDAFEYAFAENHITEKLEFICYSACLMQVQDIAEFNAPFFKYQIASEEEMIDSLIPNNWYADVVNNEDTLDVLESMVNCFIEFDGDQPDPGQCISVLDLSYMEEYKNTFEELAYKITTVNDYRVLFDNAVYHTKHFGNGAWMGGMGPHKFGLIDTLDFLDKLSMPIDENVDSPFLSLTDDMGESLIEKARTLIQQIVTMERSFGGQAGTETYARAYGMSAHIFYDYGNNDPEGTSYLIEDTSFYNWRHLFISDN